HASYDADAIERLWRILDWSDGVLEEFSGWYCGKTSPVHLFWHSFDLAVTRFGGRRAPALLAFDATADGAVTRVHRGISLKDVPTGTYVLTLTLTDPASSRRVVQRQSLQVVSSQ
ncbi:MAG TPA: DUF5996 family protein, partial [Gemmatimonadales bacterium]|nr:DUF5996 family protein [Gemmatimonadales bacterium]